MTKQFSSAQTLLRSFHKIAIVTTLLLLASTFISAQSDTKSMASISTLGQALHWRLIGPFRAGRVTCVAGIANDPTKYYFGTPGGGIWKSTDSGQVWKPIFDSVPVASIGAITVAPSDPRIVFAGTGEQTAGDGIYKSTDAGQSWTNMGLHDVLFIHSVIVDPQNPDIVVVAAAGERQADTGGIYKSSDGGKTWNKTASVDDQSSGIYDLNQAPDAPNVMYAAFLRQSARGGPPNRERANKQDAEILVSADEGSTWKQVEGQGLPTEPRGRIGIAAAPGSGGKIIYAIMSQGLFRSDDGGAHWSRITTDPRIQGNGYFSRIFIDPTKANNIYVAQTSMYRSTDGGRTFESWFGAPSGDDVHVLWINPQQPKHMILGVDQGAVVSVDGGATWSSWYNQPTGQFYHVSTDNRFPYMVFGAQQDSGTAGILSRSDFGEITAHEWAPIGGFEFSFIVPDPLNANLIYTGGWYGSVLRFDRTTSQVVPLFVRSQKYRTANMAPIAFSPQDPHLLVVGSQFVMTSRDGGTTWQEASPDLTQKAQSAEQKPGAAVEAQSDRDAVITTISLSRVHAGEIWAGTGNGLVQLTVDGKKWTDVTPSALPAHGSISLIESSAHDAATAYVVAAARDQRTPYIFRTRDYGKSWQPIVTGLRENRRARVVREDPVRKQLLFAGTEDASYFSLDDGDHWQSLQLNLPTAPVSDLDIHGDDLVASTYGRSLWILDNIAPLRQTDDFAGNAPTVLLNPSKVIRAHWDMNQDTPLPPETPAGKNPPDGAMIDYFLRAPVNDLKLEVYDSGGKLVRSIGTTPEPFDTAPPNVPSYWFANQPVLPDVAGLNRFVWNLRYPPPKTLRYSYFDNLTDYIEYTTADHAIPGETPREPLMGALVLPGRYTVALTANGRTYRRDLEVAPDPRVHVSPADLAEQLRVERVASDAMDASYEAFAQTKTLLDALKAELKQMGAATQTSSATTALTDLEKKVTEISSHEHTDLGFGPANRELARLFEMISGGGDARPAAALSQGVEDACHDIARRIEQWREVNSKDVPALNSSAGGNRLPMVMSVPAPPRCQ